MNTMEEKNDVIVVTTHDIPGYDIIEIVDVIHGVTARTRGIGGKTIAAIESIFGGEVASYTKEIEKAKKEAIDRLKINARIEGANAVIGLDIETSSIFQGLVLLSATGTAVKIKKQHKGD